MPLSPAYTTASSPSVDSTAAGRELSKRFLFNIVQAVMHQDGMGLYEHYETSGNVLEVRVLQHDGISAKSRTIGADGTQGNAKFFNGLDGEQPAHDSWLLKLNELFDRVQIIPQLMEDVIGVDILNRHAERIEQRVRQLVNAYTIAKQVSAALNYAATESDTSHIVEYDSASDAMTNVFYDASIQLDDGDSDHNIDAFSLGGRIALFRSTGKRAFFDEDKNIFAVGSSRAVELLEFGSAGGLEYNKIKPEVTGYFGELNQTPLHMAAETIWDLVEDYVGGTSLSDVIGFVAAAEGTGRGYGVSHTTKLIPTRGGQGLEMQPLVRWGVEVFFPKSIALIVKSGFVNPSVTTLLDVLGTEEVA